MRRSPKLTIAALSALALFGCSSSDASPVAPVVCTAPGYAADPQPDPVAIEQVTASFRDPSGAAVPNLNLQLCGIDQCRNGKSNALGKIDIAPESPNIVLPALKYGDGYDFAELAILLGSSPKQDLGELLALPLPAFADGAVFPKQGSVTNGDLTLFIDDAKQVDHNELNYTDDSEFVFRTVPVPLEASAQALDSSFELAYGVAPLGTKFCPPAKLSVKNTLAWPPGTDVEIFVQGLETDELWAPYASWLRVADARVSSDGSSIDTVSGGITILSAIALRRK